MDIQNMTMDELRTEMDHMFRRWFDGEMSEQEHEETLPLYLALDEEWRKRFWEQVRLQN